MDFSKLVVEHGYLITFFSALIEGETILTLGGLAAHRGYLHLPLLIVLAALGSFLGDQIYFLIGRRFGQRLIARFPRFKPAIRRVECSVGGGSAHAGGDHRRLSRSTQASHIGGRHYAWPHTGTRHHRAESIEDTILARDDHRFRQRPRTRRDHVACQLSRNVVIRRSGEGKPG
jgi:hypothetical protein